MYISITHWLGFGHETMVCAVYLSIFLSTKLMYETTQIGLSLKHYNTSPQCMLVGWPSRDTNTAYNVHLVIVTLLSISIRAGRVLSRHINFVQSHPLGKQRAASSSVFSCITTPCRICAYHKYCKNSFRFICVRLLRFNAAMYCGFF